MYVGVAQLFHPRILQFMHKILMNHIQANVRTLEQIGGIEKSSQC
jgi:hypothetical protein